MSPIRRRSPMLVSVALALTLLTPLATAGAAASAAAPAYVVLGISQSGGFISQAGASLRTPDAVLYSDGNLLVTSRVTTAVYPGPAAPTIMRKVAASAIPRVLAAADAAKVTDTDFQWGFPPLADVPDTDFTVQRSSRGPVSTVSIYALGFTGPGLTKAQVAARVAAQAFVGKLVSFDGTLVPTKSMPVPWVSPRWAYVAQPTPADEFSTIRPWLGSTPLRQTMTCVDFTAAENRKLIALLPKLNQASRWRSEGKIWQVALRPLFPHQSTCAAQN